MKQRIRMKEDGYRDKRRYVRNGERIKLQSDRFESRQIHVGPINLKNEIRRLRRSIRSIKKDHTRNKCITKKSKI